jgi:hypothetical protein
MPGVMEVVLMVDNQGMWLVMHVTPLHTVRQTIHPFKIV